MAYIGNKDFLIEVAKEKVPGHKSVDFIGKNNDVGSGSWEVLNDLGGAASFLTSPDTIRIKAGGSSNDSSSGSGARAVEIKGLDSNGDEATETIVTNGSSASSSTQTEFWRINEAKVLTCGTYGGSNIGAITIQSTGGTDLLRIPIGEGYAPTGLFSVPKGKGLFLLHTFITVETKKVLDIKVNYRTNFTNTTPPVDPVNIFTFYHDIEGLSLNIEHKTHKFSELTDVWFEAKGVGGSGAITIEQEAILFTL